MATTEEKPIIIGIERRGSHKVMVTPMFDVAGVNQQDLDMAPFGVPDEHGDVVDLRDKGGLPIPINGTTLVTTGNYRTAELLMNMKGAQRSPINCIVLL